MKKVLDKALEKKIEGIIAGGKGSKESAVEVVSTLKGLQDAGGLKVCQNVSKDDVAFREVK